MTVHKLSTGDGHLYYTNEVASGDQLRSGDRELGDYYQVSGMPPGQWIGAEAEHFGLRGQEVTELQMDALYGDGSTPIDEAKLTQWQSETRREAEESVRVEAARKAYAGLSKYRPDANNSEAIKALNTSRSAFYRTLAQHTAMGNDELARVAAAAGDESIFIDGYKMTPAEQRKATAAGNDAIRAGTDDWVEATRLGRKPGEYKQSPDNEFTRELDEQYRRHFKTMDAPPTKTERNEIQNRVAGQQFRDLHGRDGSAVEIAAYIANHSKPRQQSVAGFDHVFTPTKSVSMAWGSVMRVCVPGSSQRMRPRSTTSWIT